MYLPLNQVDKLSSADRALFPLAVLLLNFQILINANWNQKVCWEKIFYCHNLHQHLNVLSYTGCKYFTKYSSY